MDGRKLLALICTHTINACEGIPIQPAQSRRLNCAFGRPDVLPSLPFSPSRFPGRRKRRFLKSEWFLYRSRQRAYTPEVTQHIATLWRDALASMRQLPISRLGRSGLGQWLFRRKPPERKSPGYPSRPAIRHDLWGWPLIGMDKFCLDRWTIKPIKNPPGKVGWADFRK